MKPYTYSQLTFDKGMKSTQWEKNIFLRSDAGTTIQMQEKEVGPITHTIYKNWIIWVTQL